MPRKKVKYDRRPESGKKFRVLDSIREMGRSRVYLECPFCKERFWAYLWSISGGGKKCPDCGAMHSSWGKAWPVVK